MLPMFRFHKLNLCIPAFCIHGKYFTGRRLWGVLLHNWNLISAIHKLKQLVTRLLCTKATNIHKHFFP